MRISEDYPFYDFVWNFGFRDISLLWWLHWSLWLVDLKCSFNCGWLIQLYHYRQSDYKQISRKYTFKESVIIMINREITRDPIANCFKKHQRLFAAPNWTKNIKDVIRVLLPEFSTICTPICTRRLVVWFVWWHRVSLGDRPIRAWMLGSLFKWYDKS